MSDAILTELRRSCPVSTLRPGVHFAVRYEDVAEVLGDHATFSGARPSTLQGVRPEDELTLQEMDGPRHSDMRRILLTAVPRDLVERLEPSIAMACSELVDGLVPAGRAELISQLIEPAAKATVADLIGVPEADRAQVYRWAAEIKDHDATAPPARSGWTSPASGSKQAFDEWIRLETRRRRKSSRIPDDVFSRLLEATSPTREPLSEAEFATQIQFLTRAGIGSMVRLTGNLLYELIGVHERYRRVRADRGLIPIAIDESLRHDPPGDFVARTCVRDTTLAGTVIKSGDQVILSISSANRDESHFPNGEGFDLDRGLSRDHLAFGRGRHRCPGAPLARAFAFWAVSSVLDRVEMVRLEPEFRYQAISFRARGPQRLDVEFESHAG